MIHFEYLNDNAEERLNVITHGLACILAIVGGFVILLTNAHDHGANIIIALVVYIAASIMVFGSSTLYHSVSPGKLKRNLQKLDHISIFFMIAGTHTPIVVYCFSSAFGNYYLIVLWSLVIFGIFYKIFWIDKFERLGLVLYIIMGWMAIFIFPELVYMLEVQELILILAGGIAYTSGIIFYRWHSLKYHHAIWHMFVFLGGILHYIAIFLIIN
jgi:hemolysin III